MPLCLRYTDPPQKPEPQSASKNQNPDSWQSLPLWCLPANGRRGRHSEILYFKQHVDVRSELDAFTVCETQQFVVVQDGVHILYPERVDGSVADYPLTVHTCVLRNKSTNEYVNI